MPEAGFINPDRVTELLNLEEGMKVAEFGCGTGLFSLAAGRRVGRDGKVFAIDVQKAPLESLQSRARLDGVYNIETIWADLERVGATKIPEAAVDVTLIPNMLFQSQKKGDVLKEAHRVTKSGGSAVIIDWYPEKAIFGKQMGWPVPSAEMRNIAEEAGFTFMQEVQTGSAFHYGLLFKK